MSSTAMAVRDMLDALEEEDCKMAISYIQFLLDSKKKERVRRAADAVMLMLLYIICPLS